MTEEPQQPEGEAPEDEAPEGAPGEPGEGTPSETEPQEGDSPSGPAPDAGEDASGEDSIPAGAPEEEPAASEAPGPEIEGLEELGQATTSEAADEPVAEAAEEPVAEAAEEPAAEGADEPAAEGAEEPAEGADEPAPAGPAAAAEAPSERPRGRREKGDGGQEEVIPGAHLEPDLVLDEQRSEEGEYDEYGQYADADSEAAATEDGEPGEEGAEPAPVAHTPLELAADARYNATGKRKSAIARVILKPGEGTYTVNGRHLDEYFPRVRLQRMASQPLEAAGYHTRMDVVARIHGGGVSAQANALRHGIARALVEADPALRTELKRRGYLTRDPREKERKKAGLKKARKRPQFSKR
jgi:small subunit ribosomal protein S9